MPNGAGNPARAVGEMILMTGPNATEPSGSPIDPSPTLPDDRLAQADDRPNEPAGTVLYQDPVATEVGSIPKRSVGQDTSPLMGIGPLALPLAARVDKLCDGFEAAWMAGQRPRIEDYLGNEAEPMRTALFRELLVSELECRRRLGAQPVSGDYEGRFPEFHALIREVFCAGTVVSEGEPTAGSTVMFYPVEPPIRPGRYVIKRFHARGGIGEVYLAEDSEIGRTVALKQLREPTANQERFLAEAQVTGQLEHPGIVPVHDLGTDEQGRPFYVMKFVNGRTMKAVIAESHAETVEDVPRELLRHRLLEGFVSLCHTVAYAHSRGVVHRDLKPDNVMVGEYGETLLLDWGLAKVVGHPFVRGGSEFVQLTSSGGSSATIAGAYMGSPPYMSPELADGHADEADERTDVYLLGATLYEILTGRTLRQGSSREEILELARTVDPLPPRELKPEVPKALEAVCMKALARRKQDRYPGALALAEDVQLYLAGEPVSVYREGTLARAARWSRRHRRGVERAAVAVLVVGVGLSALVALHRSERVRSEATREAARLQRMEDARRDVVKFRDLAEQSHFYAVSTVPDDERAPYYDPREAESRGLAALVIADAWGPQLESLPLTQERKGLRRELYDLLLLLAQTRMFRPNQEPGSAKETIAWLERAATLRGPTRSYYRVRADALRLAGNLEAADAALRAAENPLTPTVAMDHFLLGESDRTATAESDDVSDATQKRNRARLERAIESYRNALELDPDHYWSHFQLGRCYLALRRDAEAIEALGACLALRPDAPWGYSARGLALALMKRYPEAIRDLDRAAALDFRPARLNRGAVYWFQKKPDEALAEFEAVLQPPADRRLIEAAYYRGRVLLESGREDEALADFDSVIFESPSFRPAYLARAQLFVLRGDQIRGRSDFYHYLALARDPGFDAEGSESRRLWATFLRNSATKASEGGNKRLGRRLLDEARVELLKAADLGNRSSALFEDLGTVYEQLGKLPEAVVAYARAAALDPKAAQPLVMRGWIRVGLKQYAQAHDDFTEAIRRDPEHAEAHTGLGFVQACRNGPAEAQQEALQALLLRETTHRANDYLVFHNTACIYAELARADSIRSAQYESQAIKLLQRAVALWKRRGSGPNELAIIKGEPAFGASLRARMDFQALLGTGE